MHASYLRSLRLLQAEAVVTGMVFAMPILTIFFQKELGMSMSQIGLSQAIFTLPLLTLNVIGGWIADAFSRKACNIFGDSLEVLGFGLYTFADSFSDVLVAELILGVGIAFSAGADTALFQAYAERLAMSYTVIAAQTNKWRTVGEAIAVGIGGVVGAYSPRVAIAMSMATGLIGVILSSYITEAGERRVRRGSTLHGTAIYALRDIASITRYTLYGHRPLAWRVFASALANNTTHALIWVLTPLMIMAGVPAAIIGVGWMLTLFGVWCGSQAAQLAPERLQDHHRYAVGAVMFVITALVLTLSVNIVTIWLYAGFGFARGWFSSIMSPIILRHAPSDTHSTVSSLTGTLANALYIPLVWGLGTLGDISPQLSVSASLILFAPLLLLVVHKLSIYERK